MLQIQDFFYSQVFVLYVGFGTNFIYYYCFGGYFMVQVAMGNDFIRLVSVKDVKD